MIYLVLRTGLLDYSKVNISIDSESHAEEPPFLPIRERTYLHNDAFKKAFIDAAIYYIVSCVIKVLIVNLYCIPQICR